MSHFLFVEMRKQHYATVDSNTYIDQYESMNKLQNVDDATINEINLKLLNDEEIAELNDEYSDSVSTFNYPALVDNCQQRRVDTSTTQTKFDRSHVVVVNKHPSRSTIDNTNVQLEFDCDKNENVSDVSSKSGVYPENFLKKMQQKCMHARNIVNTKLAQMPIVVPAGVPLNELQKYKISNSDISKSSKSSAQQPAIGATTDLTNMKNKNINYKHNVSDNKNTNNIQLINQKHANNSSSSSTNFGNNSDNSFSDSNKSFNDSNNIFNDYKDVSKANKNFNENKIYKSSLSPNLEELQKKNVQEKKILAESIEIDKTKMSKLGQMAAGERW